MISANYIQTTWSNVPQYVCTGCGFSTVGLLRGPGRIVNHLQALHAETPEPVPAEEPTETPDEEPGNAPEDEPEHEPVETEA